MTDRKVFSLTLIRHGQTVANVQKVIQGLSDTLLTRLGCEQAELLGKFLSKQPGRNRKIYTSDQERALKTCEIIAANMDIPHVAIRKDLRLRERKYGKYEGRPISEFLLEAYDHGYDDSNFTLYSPEGVESMDQVRARVLDFLRSLCRESNNGDDVLVVSHWGTIKEFLKAFQPVSNGAITQNHLVESPNAAFSRLRIECNTPNSDGAGNDFIADVQVICLHQTPHLVDDQTSVNLDRPLK